VDNNFKLVGDKPRESASDFHRFEIRVPAGESKTQTVTEERDEFTRFDLNTEGDDRIKWLATQPVVSAKVKAGLTEAMKLRWAAIKTRDELNDLKRQLDVIEKDQGRLRANLAATPSTAQVYKKYLKKLDDQEVVIEKLQEKVEKAEKQALSHKKAFDDFLANFSAD
jgi:hypothetical protein